MPEEKNEQPSQPPQPKIEFVVPDPDDSLFTTYANNVNIGWTHFDVRMVFGEVVDVLAGKIVVENRAQITVSYLQAKLLAIFLGQAIAQHENVFGEIKLPPDFSVTSQVTEARMTPGTPARPPRS
jgi:hypothetical protein